MAFSDDNDDDNTSLSTPLLPLSPPPPKPLLLSGDSDVDSRSTTLPPHNSQLSSSSYIKPLAVLSGHAGTISCLALCGEFVLSASHGRDSIIVWQQPDLRQFARFGDNNNNGSSVKALAVVGSRVFTAHQDSRIRVWKLSSSSSSSDHQNQNLFRLISTLPTTKDYLGNCMNRRNYVDQTRRNHRRRLWIEHADTISCLAASSNNHGTIIYSGSWDKTLKVWRVADLKCLESINAHDDAINALAVYNNVVYSASADGTIKVWEKEKENAHCLKAVLQGRSKDDGRNAAAAAIITMSWNAVIVCNQGRVVYGGGSDGRVMGWETTTSTDDQWSVVCNVRAHEMAVLCMCTMGDRFVCTGSADKSIGVWMMNGEEERGSGGLWKVGVMKGHEGPVKCLQASWNSVGEGFMLYSGGVDKSLRVWWVPKRGGYRYIQ